MVRVVIRMKSGKEWDISLDDNNFVEAVNTVLATKTNASHALLYGAGLLLRVSEVESIVEVIN